MNLIISAILAFLVVDFCLVLWLLWRNTREPAAPGHLGFDSGPNHLSLFFWPTSWLAAKTRTMLKVQTALRLHHPKPCSWYEGLTPDDKIFIAPRLDGWILAIGGLPDPADDIDRFFEFMLELSRQLGEVQFFRADPVLYHHAWVKARRGKIVRGYAWAGRTLWNQGSITAEEKQLGVTCFGYAEAAQVPGITALAENNVRKVPLLAAAWGFDPIHIYEHLHNDQCGIAGEPVKLT